MQFDFLVGLNLTIPSEIMGEVPYSMLEMVLSRES